MLGLKKKEKREEEHEKGINKIVTEVRIRESLVLVGCSPAFCCYYNLQC